MIKSALFLSVSALLAAGCARDSRNQYNEAEVGRSRIVEFGTIVSEREVGVTGHNSGTGALLGGAAGGGGGSYLGRGGGGLWTTAAGAVVGAVAGGLAEQAASNHRGIEYTITKQNGQTLTLVQNAADGEAPLPAGSRVIIQTSGSYQRVLPAAALPETVERPRGIRMVD